MFPIVHPGNGERVEQRISCPPKPGHLRASRAHARPRKCPRGSPGFARPAADPRVSRPGTLPLTSGGNVRMSGACPDNPNGVDGLVFA